MSYRFLLLTFLVLIIWSTQVKADDLPCEGCSYSVMESAAKGAGIGHHRVYSVSTADIEGFSVVCPTGSPQNRGTEVTRGATTSSNCNRPLRANWVGVTQAAYDAMTAINIFYVSNGDSLSKTNEVVFVGQPGTSQFGGSVYNVLNDYPARQAMFDWIRSNQTAFDNYATAAGAATLAALNIMPNQIDIDITFEDGSTVKVVYFSATYTMQIVATSARGANGVAVIEGNGPGFAGNYSVTGVNLAAYLSYLSSLGVNVTGGGSGITLTCTWVPPVLTCAVSP